jgi:hypothetical protein
MTALGIRDPGIEQREGGAGTDGLGVQSAVPEQRAVGAGNKGNAGGGPRRVVREGGSSAVSAA